MSEAKGKAWEELGNDLCPFKNDSKITDDGRGNAMKIGFYRGFDAGRASRDGLREASQWALEFFKARDEMNAKVHCSPIRLSPITERFMKALEADGEGEK